MMSYVFGIDLGTTYSCIAYVDQYGKPVVLKNSEGDHTTPSVVFFENEKNVVVGKEAKATVEIEPDKTVQFIKRKIGKENDTVTVNGITYTAPEISAYILRKLVKDANDELKQTGVIQPGQEIKDVVITCPAYFGMSERQATKDAGELAGLNVLNIINEPTAAAISYGIAGAAKKETVLIYDLGGGTFDVTIMDIDGTNISVVCTGGDDSLGGKDWDEALMKYVMEQYEGEGKENLMEDPDAVAVLYIDVENWKKALSVREKVKISVNSGSDRFREDLSREKYEEITAHLLSRTKNKLDDMLKDAAAKGYPKEKIDRVLLVGGSSRMPQVAAMLERDYHVTPSLQDPDEAVAKGAAIYANNQQEFHEFAKQEAAKQGKTAEELEEENIRTGALDKAYMKASGSSSGSMKVKITNVLSRTYGTETVDRYTKKHHITNMLFANTKLPASNTKTFETLEDNQSGVDILIYESNSTEETIEIGERKPIATALMVFSNPVPRDTPIIVTFTLDNSGLLHIVAEEQLYHSKLDTKIDLQNHMTEAQKQMASNRMDNATVE